MRIEFFIAILLFVVIPLIVSFVIYIQSENNIWVHIKTNNQYTVFSLGKLKDPTTGEWVDAVFYSSLKDGKNYSRKIEDFGTHFIKYTIWKKKKD